MKQLPNGWRHIKLNDEELFRFENGLWTGKKLPLMECAVLRNTNFTDRGDLDLSNVAFIEIEARQLDRKRLEHGDIIIERSGGGPSQPVGRVAYFDSSGDFCFSNFTTRLRVIDESVEPSFLHLKLFHFHLSGATEMLQQRTTGIRNLDFNNYKNVEHSLPPIPEQRQIVSALRAIQNARDERTAETQLEREHKAALMAHLFSHGTHGVAAVETPLGKLPRNWEIVKMEDICAAVQYGTSEKCGDDSSQIPVIRIPNIVNEKLDDTNLKYAAFEPKVIERLRLKVGDIIFVRTNGNKEYTGRCAVYEGKPKIALFASYLIRAQLQQDKALPQFVQIYCSTPMGRSYLGGRASNAADGKFNINSQTIRSVLVPLPPLDEQQEIAAILRACDDKIAALEDESTRLEELFRAMLEELMSGRISVAALL